MHCGCGNGHTRGGQNSVDAGVDKDAGVEKMDTGRDDGGPAEREVGSDRSQALGRRCSQLWCVRACVQCVCVVYSGGRKRVPNPCCVPRALPVLLFRFEGSTHVSEVCRGVLSEAELSAGVSATPRYPENPPRQPTSPPRTPKSPLDSAAKMGP